MTKPTRISRVYGSIFGVAYGDALGRPTEFMTVPQIVHEYGPHGPTDLPSPALVTDDTQMMLAVGRASMDSWPFHQGFRQAFIDWSRGDLNGRAPGGTCMGSCRRLAHSPHAPWQALTDMGSKGCGANMRVTPIGLMDTSLDDMAGLAQLQAAMTHAHPTALAAADLTACATRIFANGTGQGRGIGLIPKLLRKYAEDQRSVYRERWLGDLNVYAGQSLNPRRWIASGWDEVIAGLDTLDNALASPRPDVDPCSTTGAGWTAEEALMTALHCCLLFPHDPQAALTRAATTSGDSDSIACLVGAFMGAKCGMNAWPAHWMDRIEYRGQLIDLSEQLT